MWYAIPTMVVLLCVLKGGEGGGGSEAEENSLCFQEEEGEGRKAGRKSLPESIQ